MPTLGYESSALKSLSAGSCGYYLMSHGMGKSASALSADAQQLGEARSGLHQQNHMYTSTIVYQLMVQ